MNPEKIGQFIKEIRVKNNLTQKDLADKYNVTYQAVSKWENGKNLPDILLIRQMAKDFNINVEDILDGSVNKKRNILLYIIPIIIVILLVIVVILINNLNSGFNTSSVSSMCSDFDVNGMITYDKNKSSIFISKVNYNGCEDNIIYKRIECNLYEDNILIKSCIVKENTTLKDYLNEVSFYIDNYEQVCKNYDNNTIKLNIKAIKDDGTTKNYEIPLNLESNCN